MQIRLNPELEAFVKELVDEGLFLCPEEAVENGLWLLRDQYLLNKVKREELRKLVAVGVEQSERGQVAPLNMEAIKAKALARLQQARIEEANNAPGDPNGSGGIGSDRHSGVPGPA